MTKKKSLIIQIIISAVIILLLVGVFAFFMLKNKDMNLDKARKLMNNVCQDMGYIDENGEIINQSFSSADFPKEDYDGTEVIWDPNDEVGGQARRNASFTFIMLSKYLIEQEDFKFGNFYTSTAELGDYTQVCYLRITSNKNDIIINMINNDSVKVYIKITEGKNDSWEMDIKINIEDDTHSYQNAFYKYDGEKFYEFSYYQLDFNNTLSSIDDIDMFDVLSTDIVNKKLTNFVYYNHGEGPDCNTLNLTNEQIFNNAKDFKNQIESSTDFKDLIDRDDYKETDILEKLSNEINA